MKTYKIKRDKENHLIVDGMITTKDINAIKRKMDKKNIKVEKLPIRKWQEITLFNYDYE